MNETKVIMMMNQKGGVAKTTTALNLGAALAAIGKRVLLIDIDSQASLTKGLGIKPESQKYTIIDALTRLACDEEIKPEFGIAKTSTENMDIISGSIKGIELEKRLDANPVQRTRELLREYIDEQRGTYDYILIDSGPTLGTLTLNGLVAADSVIIPCEPEPAASDGLQNMIETVFKVKQVVNHKLGIEGILITKYDSQKKAHKIVSSQIRKEYGKKINIYGFNVPLSSELPNAAMERKDIFSMKTKKGACAAYEMLAYEVEHTKPEIQKYSPTKLSFIKKIFGIKEEVR